MMNESLCLICDLCSRPFKAPVILTTCPSCAHLWDTVQQADGWARPLTMLELQQAARHARRVVVPLRPVRRTA